MNITILSGSRNPSGQTARAANALKDGILTGKECSADLIFLPGLNLERCRQCDDAGWGTCSSQGECCINDDFSMLLERIKKSDIIVFATPVYFGDISESLHAFLMRLRRVYWNSQDEAIVHNKPAVGICVAGGGGGGSVECTERLSFILQTCGFNITDMFPVRRQNLDEKVDLLKEAGIHLAQR